MAEIDAKNGTTTVGIVYKDGVVLATDQRVTMGNMVISKVEKVFPITDFLAITTAGTVSDNQMLVKHMRAEMKLYELEGERKATVETFSSVLQNVVYSGYKRWQPYMIQAIIAGRSRDGSFKLFSFDPSAASVEDRYTATGSGMMFALGIIQDNYKEGMSEVEAVELAARSIYAAIRRDTATGEGIDVYTITKQGVKKVFAERLNTNITC